MATRKDITQSNRLRFAVLATDIALFTLREGALWVRLITVNRPPYFTNTPGLPGGLLKPQETAEETATRIIKEKTNIAPRKVHVEQLATFSGVKRDPRGRVVAVAELGLVAWDSLSSEERQDNDQTYWCRADHIPKLAYDHNEILTVALERLRTRISYSTLIAKLLPRAFTLSELEAAYETILNRSIDKRNFRKKIKKLKVVVSLNRQRTGTQWRPAMLYRFRSPKVLVTEIV